MKYDIDKVTKGVEIILEGMGLNWKEDDNFKETPQRVARMYRELNSGLYEEYDGTKIFPTNYTGMVFLKDIRAVGLCPHHLMPIEYSISFAYIPVKYVIGLSKIPRIIKNLCARPVLQEDLTKDIVNYFEKKLHPLGIAIVIEGVHGCMKYRGIKEEEKVKTSQIQGVFFENEKTRNEFYNLLNK